MSLESNVTKALLVLSANLSNDIPLTQKIRFRLYSAGFIIIREEHRDLNTEVAVRLSSTAALNVPSPSAVSGRVYVYCVATANCAERLAAFVADSANSSLLKNEAYCTTQGAAGATIATTASRGVQLLFPRVCVDEIPSGIEAREYVHEELKGLLMSGLTELSKQKPKNPVEWLARYLLENNPRSPPVTVTN